MTIELCGTGVSRGIVIGRAQIVYGSTPDIIERKLKANQLDAEVDRLEQALSTAKLQLQDLKDQIPEGTPADIAGFIDAHLLMLDDSALRVGVAQLIRERRCNAEWALKIQRDQLAAVFEAMDDAYLSARRDDVDHVVSRVQRTLLDQAPGLESQSIEVNDVSEPVILVAQDISPADFVLIQSRGVAAVITEYGGPLSHTAILARSLNIPAIVGLHRARQLIQEDETIVIDGHSGRVLLSPDASDLRHYQLKQAEEQQQRSELAKLRQVAAITEDGETFTLLANIELPNDLTAVVEAGAAGVGLYRTEFLYMNRDDVPTEQEQLDAYRHVMAGLNGATMTVRTLDLGADKTVDGGHYGGSVANNPALGLRGIRLCLRDHGLFKPQLRALLRVAAEGSVRIMLPMVSSLEEIRRTRAVIEATAVELQQEGILHNKEVDLGVMIEVPAAALAARELAEEADFFSIGTNDLIQYTLAIDRIDDEVNYLYDPLNPAVLALIANTISAGREANIPVGMCGEMAGDTRYTALLVGLGLTEFSMHPATLLEVKQRILGLNAKTLRAQAAEFLACQDRRQAQAILQQLLDTQIA